MAKKKAEELNVELMVKLVGYMRDEHTKLGDLINEFDNLLAGKPGLGHMLQASYAHFDKLWSANYRGKHVWTMKQDTPNMKRLLKMLGIDELMLRMNRFFRDRSAYLVERRHPFALFVTHINDYAEWAPGVAEEDAPTITGCLHSPACTSDQQHTKRRQQEMLEVND